ncbi:MAG: hypothetical protein ACP5N1_06270 [Candidatus Woesearchaeota archaeon]
MSIVSNVFSKASSKFGELVAPIKNMYKVLPLAAALSACSITSNTSYPYDPIYGDGTKPVTKMIITKDSNDNSNSNGNTLNLEDRLGNDSIDLYPIASDAENFANSDSDESVTTIIVYDSWNNNRYASYYSPYSFMDFDNDGIFNFNDPRPYTFGPYIDTNGNGTIDWQDIRIAPYYSPAYYSYGFYGPSLGFYWDSYGFYDPWVFDWGFGWNPHFHGDLRWGHDWDHHNHHHHHHNSHYYGGNDHNGYGNNNDNDYYGHRPSNIGSGRTLGNASGIAVPTPNRRSGVPIEPRGKNSKITDGRSGNVAPSNSAIPKSRTTIDSKTNQYDRNSNNRKYVPSEDNKNRKTQQYTPAKPQRKTQDYKAPENNYERNTNNRQYTPPKENNTEPVRKYTPPVTPRKQEPTYTSPKRDNSQQQKQSTPERNYNPPKSNYSPPKSSGNNNRSVSPSPSQNNSRSSAPANNKSSGSSGSSSKNSGRR